MTALLPLLSASASERVRCVEYNSRPAIRPGGCCVFVICSIPRLRLRRTAPCRRRRRSGNRPSRRRCRRSILCAFSSFCSAGDLRFRLGRLVFCGSTAVGTESCPFGHLCSTLAAIHALRPSFSGCFVYGSAGCIASKSVSDIAPRKRLPALPCTTLRAGTA